MDSSLLWLAVALVAVVAAVYLAAVLPRRVVGLLAAERTLRGFSDAEKTAIVQAAATQVAEVLLPLRQYEKSAHLALWHQWRFATWWFRFSHAQAQASPAPEELVARLYYGLARAEDVQHCRQDNCTAELCTCDSVTCTCRRARVLFRIAHQAVTGEAAPRGPASAPRVAVPTPRMDGAAPPAPPAAPDPNGGAPAAEVSAADAGAPSVGAVSTVPRPGAVPVSRERQRPTGPAEVRGDAAADVGPTADGVAPRQASPSSPTLVSEGGAVATTQPGPRVEVKT
jgi:hypothetical protein